MATVITRTAGARTLRPGSMAASPASERWFTYSGAFYEARFASKRMKPRGKPPKGPHIANVGETQSTTAGKTIPKSSLRSQHSYSPIEASLQNSTRHRGAKKPGNDTADLHALGDNGVKQTSSSTSGQSLAKRRSSWDPLARYRSEANSLPDYGSRSDMTMSKRLKDINGIYRPRNTLAKPPTPVSAKLPSSPIEIADNSPPPKRRNDRDDVQSPYWTKDSVQNRRLREGSDDIYELKSVSSTGKERYPSHIEAYRHTLSKTEPRKRRRGRTDRKPSSSIDDQSIISSSLASEGLPHDTLRSDPQSLDSPDILTGAETSPLKGAVTTRFAISTKRTRDSTDSATPHFKRRKAMESQDFIESEDELSANLSQQRLSVASKRTTNFEYLGSTPSTRRPRGEIQPTVFKSPHSKTQKWAGITALHVRRAVDGKHIYDWEENRDQDIVLRPDESNVKLVPSRTASGELSSLAWLEIDVGQIKEILHACTHSPYVCIERPRSHLGGGATLWLELAGLEGVAKLVTAAPRSLVKEYPLEKLENRYIMAVKNAKKYVGASYVDKPPSAVAVRKKSTGSDVMALSSDTHILNGGRAPKRTRLVDKLRASGVETPQSTNSPATEEKSVISTAPVTRRTRRLSPAAVPRASSPDRWTVLNPGWKKDWHKSLVFPATGKNRTTVDSDDIDRLDEGEFLNDNLISFYIRYLHSKLEAENPELLNKVYFFNTFFFEKLRSTKGKINYDGVKAWTAKFDLLAYDYIVVPVNENAHWYLAIICNAPNALHGVPEDSESEVEHSKGPESPDIGEIQRDMSDVSIREENSKLETTSPSSCAVSSSQTQNTKPSTDAGAPHVDPRLPKIVTLDSLGSPHPATCRVLKQYLIEEAKDKKGVELARNPSGMTAKRIPEQDNFCDCGVYVLGYMEEFLKDPEETVRRLLQKEAMNWVIRPSALRNKLRDLLFKLQAEQQQRLETERQAKKQQRAAVKAKSESDDRSSPVQQTPVKLNAPVGPVNDTSETTHSHQLIDKIDETVTEAGSHRGQTPNKRRASAAVEGSEVGDSRGDTRQDSEVSFVKQLPSSATEGSQGARPRTPKRDKAKHAVVTSDGDVVVTHSSSRRSHPLSSPLYSPPPLVRPLRSSQSESPRTTRTATYDRIETAVDLT